MTAATRRAGWVSVAVLWALAPLLLTLSIYRPFTPSRGRAGALPTDLPGFALIEERAMTPRHYELLGTDDAAWRVYRRVSDGAHVFVIAVYHRENWKSVHPPHICLRGSDMAILDDGELEVEIDGEPLAVGRILTHHNPARADYVSLYVYGAGGLTTASYPEFFMHHAPSALLRQPIEGFLLRVEAYVGADGDQGTGTVALDDGHDAGTGDTGLRLQAHVRQDFRDLGGGVELAVAQLRVLVEPAAPFDHLGLHGSGRLVDVVEGQLRLGRQGQGSEQ